MLVLTRKLQQQIKIGEQITVTILRVKGHTVRVGIDAPRDVRVIRGELPRDAQAAETETTIIEATLTVSDDDHESEDDAAGPRSGPRQTGSTFAVPGPEVSDPSAHAALRLPQRKRFNRTSTPPLRVAATLASSSLAK